MLWHRICKKGGAVFPHPGSVTCPPGSPLGDGLTREAAADLGLDPGTAVGASLIDAHAGGLGIRALTCFLSQSYSAKYIVFFKVYSHFADSTQLWEVWNINF